MGVFGGGGSLDGEGLDGSGLGAGEVQVLKSQSEDVRVTHAGLVGLAPGVN